SAAPFARSSGSTGAGPSSEGRKAMVITERFAWAHLPKTAGDATAQMFAAVPGLVLYQAPLDSNEKHDGFWVHADAIEGKLRVMNIRRLPSWILSIAHHK